MNTDFAWISEVDTKPLRNYTYHEAKAKYDKWKTEKDKIKVGDEIISSDGIKSVILHITKWGDLECLNEDGIFTIYEIDKQYWKKTGRHFDAIDKLLNKMKE